jgi:hypothetical protein
MLRNRLSKFAALAVTLGLSAAGAAQAAQSPKLYGYPCRSAASCHVAAMYKPRTFQLGSHYWFTNVSWKSWNAFTASAVLTLHHEFPGARPGSDRTIVVFSHSRTLCGVKTYTSWVSGDGNAQDAETVPGTKTCMWYLGNP